MKIANATEMNMTKKIARVLPDLTAEQKRIAELEAIVAELTAPKPLTVKLNPEKGTISVYGLGRYPTTLYRDQWSRLAEFMPKVEAFIKANAKQLEVAQRAWLASKSNGAETREVAA